MMKRSNLGRNVIFVGLFAMVVYTVYTISKSKDANEAIKNDCDGIRGRIDDIRNRIDLLNKKIGSINQSAKKQEFYFYDDTPEYDEEKTENDIDLEIE